MQIWAPSLLAMLQFLCNLQLPRCACSVTMMPELLLSTKVLRDSLSLGQLCKLKIPASLMTRSSAKSFNLIYKCFKVTEVSFFEAKKGTAGLPAICFLNSLNGSRALAFLRLKSFDYLRVQMEKTQHIF